MTSRLPDLLSADDLPWVELQAAVLDGDLVRIGDFFATAGGFDSPRLRARAVWSVFPSGVVASGLSAAWVWGAAPHPPSPHEAVVGHLGRRLMLVPGVDVREIVLESTDQTSIGPLAVTTPARTVVDLTRRERWSDTECGVVQALIDREAVTRASCDAVLFRRSHVPHSKRSRARLDAMQFAPDQPPLTR